MKTRIGRIIIAATLAACAEQAATTAPLVEEGTSNRYIEGQQAPPGVPPEYDVPTSIDVEAGGGTTNISSGLRAYGQSVVNYTGTSGLAKARLEIDGYPDALGETQKSTLLPLSNGITATALRNIAETCGKSLRTEAFGSAWNEFVSSSVLSWGRLSGSETYPFALNACQITQPPSSRYVQERDEAGCQVYVVEYRNSAGVWVEFNRIYVCPDENTGFYSRQQIDRPLGAAATTRTAGAPQPPQSAGASGARSAGRAATIQFIGTGFMDARTHLTIHAGGPQADAIVLVDTMRASAEDLEAALIALSQLGDQLPSGARIDVAKHVLKGQSRARAANRAKPLLAAIKQSRDRASADGYVGRSLSTSVMLPPTREGKRKG
jgi:hypothetical protein